MSFLLFNSGGEDFNQFILDIQSFLYIICLFMCSKEKGHQYLFGSSTQRGHWRICPTIKITYGLALVSSSEPNGLSKQGCRAGACLQEKIKWLMQNAKIVCTVFTAVRRRRHCGGAAAHAPLGRQNMAPTVCLAEGRDLAKFLRSLEQFLQTVKEIRIFFETEIFLTYSWDFLRCDTLEQSISNSN